jgi:hypothetical protein
VAGSAGCVEREQRARIRPHLEDMRDAIITRGGSIENHLLENINRGTSPFHMVR